MWLETVEIKEVLIKNEQLFKDMQSKYRENIKRNADLNKITTEETLTKLRNENKQIIAELMNKKKLEIEEFRQASEVKILEQVTKDKERIAELDQEINEVSNKHDQLINTMNAEKQIQLNQDHTRVTDKQYEI